MAGVALHAKVIENCLTDGTDQSHLRVIHISFSADLVDRTDFLLGRVAVNPAEGMARAFRVAWRGIEAEGLEAVGGVPCNTFHAPAIMDAFKAALERDGTRIPVVDMLAESIVLLEAGMGTGAVGILSTTGTRKAGIWRAALSDAGFRPVEVGQRSQDAVHEAIYHRAWGLKAANPPSSRSRGILLEAVEELAAAAPRRSSSRAPRFPWPCQKRTSGASA
jgi:aspartate racemase